MSAKKSSEVQEQFSNNGVDLTEREAMRMVEIFEEVGRALSVSMASVMGSAIQILNAVNSSTGTLKEISEQLREMGDKKKDEIEKKRSRKSGELLALEDEFLEKWNTFAADVGLSKAQLFTSRDRANFAARMKELKRRTGSDSEAFAALLRIMEKIRDQPFALGRVKGKKWKIDVHQFLTAAKFSNVESGSYGETLGAHTEADGSVRDDSLF